MTDRVKKRKWIKEMTDSDSSMLSKSIVRAYYTMIANKFNYDEEAYREYCKSLPVLSMDELMGRRVITER